MGAEEGGGPTGVSVALVALFGVVVALTVVLMVVSFPVGLYTVYFTPLSNSTSYTSSIYGIYIIFGLVPVEVPVATTIGTMFLAFLTVYACFFALAAVQGGGVLRAISGALSGRSGRLMENPLTAMVLSLGGLSFGITILDFLQTSSGIPTGSISGEPLSLFLGITMAPLTEEFGFRLALIGVPLFLAVLASRSSLPRAAKVLWRPSAAWDGAAGSSEGAHGTKTLTYALLVASSFLFGLAHYLANSGWGVGKISEAGIAGAVLAYLYIRYGFHTNVLLHWGVNYFGTVFAFFSQGVWGIPWTSDSGSTLSVFMTLEIIVLLGIPSFLFFAHLLLKRAFRAAPTAATGVASAE